MTHHTPHHEDAPTPAYRKKQMPLVILVFVCIAAAFWSGSFKVSVPCILAACGLIFWAGSMEPKKAPEEHHH